MGRTILVLILVETIVCAQSPQEKRDILRFGLENQVVELLRAMGQQRDGAWKAEVLKALESDPPRAVLEAALRYFIQLESDKARDHLATIVPKLEDWPMAMVLTVTEYAGALGITEHSEAFARHLDSDNLGLKGAVIRLLGKLKAEEHASRFLEMLRDPLSPQELTPDLVTSLGLLGYSPATEEIVDILMDSGSGFALKSLCLDALARIGGIKAESAIRDHLNNDNAVVRASALRNAVKFTGLATETATFLRALRDSTASVRIAAAEALAERPMPEAMEHLLFRIAHDPEMEVRSAALKALHALDRGEWERQILETLEKRPQNSVFWNDAVQIALENQMGAAIPLLRTILQREGRLSNSPFVTTIANLLSTSSWAASEELYTDVMATSNQNAQLTILRTIQRKDLRSLRGSLELWVNLSRFPQVQFFIRNLLRDWDNPDPN